MTFILEGSSYALEPVIDRLPQGDSVLRRLGSLGHIAELTKCLRKMTAESIIVHTDLTKMGTAPKHRPRSRSKLTGRRSGRQRHRCRPIPSPWCSSKCRRTSSPKNSRSRRTSWIPSFPYRRRCSNSRCLSHRLTGE